MPLGSDKARDSREQAWQRLLQQLEARQRYVDDTAAEEDAAYQAQLRQQEEDSAGAQAVGGAQLGMAAGGPWGALIGGIAGKAKGSIEYGQKHGFWDGVGKFLDPRGEMNTLVGSAGGMKAGGSIAKGFAADRARKQRATMNDMNTLQGDRDRFGAMKPGESMADSDNRNTGLTSKPDMYRLGKTDDEAANEEAIRRLVRRGHSRGTDG